jgi:hypothetical protein
LIVSVAVIIAIGIHKGWVLRGFGIGNRNVRGQSNLDRVPRKLTWRDRDA